MTDESNKEIDEIFDLYQEQLWNAMTDENIRLALSRAVESFRRNRDETFKLYPHVREKAKELRKIKEYSLLHVEELAKQVKERVEDLKGHCLIARKPEDALKHLREIVTEGDTVVKSKTMTCEELHINTYLEKLGCNVYETDLGEFIIQHLKNKPMHDVCMVIPRIRILNC